MPGRFEKMPSDRSESSNDDDEDDRGKAALDRIRMGRGSDDDDSTEDSTSDTTSLDPEEVARSSVTKSVGTRSEKEVFQRFDFNESPQKQPSTPEQDPLPISSPCVSPVPVAREQISEPSSHRSSPHDDDHDDDHTSKEHDNNNNNINNINIDNSLEEELANLRVPETQRHEEPEHEMSDPEAEDQSTTHSRNSVRMMTNSLQREVEVLQETASEKDDEEEEEPQTALQEPRQQQSDQRTPLIIHEGYQQSQSTDVDQTTLEDEVDKNDALDIAKGLSPAAVCDMSSGKRTKIPQRAAINASVLIASRNALSKLSNLPYTLVRLDVSRNSLVEMAGISHLVNLEVANFRRNHIRKISGLESCSQLRHLFLGHNPIRNIENIEHLQRLETLDCSHTNLSSATNVRALSLNSGLRTLMLRGSPVADPAGRRRVILNNVSPYCTVRFIARVASSFGNVEKVEERPSPDGSLSFCVTYSMSSSTVREAITVAVSSRESDPDLSSIVVCRSKTNHLIIKDIPKHYQYTGEWENRVSAPLKTDIPLIIRTILSPELESSVASYEVRKVTSWGYKGRMQDKSPTPFSGQISVSLSRAYQLSGMKGGFHCPIVAGGPVWEFDFSTMVMKEVLTGKTRMVVPPRDNFDLHLTFREGVEAAKLLKDESCDSVLADICTAAKLTPADVADCKKAVSDTDRIIVSRQLMDYIPLVSNLCPLLQILDDKKLTGKGRESIYQTTSTNSTIHQTSASLLSTEMDVSLIAASAYQAASEKYHQPGLDLDAVLKTPYQMMPAYSAPKKAQMMHQRMVRGRAQGSPPRALQQTISSSVKARGSPIRSPARSHDTSRFLEGRILPSDVGDTSASSSPRHEMIPQPASFTEPSQLPVFQYDAEEQQQQPAQVSDPRQQKSVRGFTPSHSLRSRSKGLGKGIRQQQQQQQQPLPQQQERYFKVDEPPTNPKRAEPQVTTQQQQQQQQQQRHHQRHQVANKPQSQQAAAALEKVMSKMCKAKGKPISTPLVQQGINGLSAIPDDSYSTTRSRSENSRKPSKTAIQILSELHNEEGSESPTEAMRGVDAKNVRFAPGSSPPAERQQRHIVNRETEQKTKPKSSGVEDLVTAWETQYGSDFVTLHLALKTLLVLVEEGSSKELLRYKDIVQSCGMLKPTEIPPEVSLFYGVTSESEVSHPTSSPLSKKDQLLAMISQTFQTKACLEYIFTLMEENNYLVLADYLAKVKESLCMDNQYVGM